MSLPFIRNATPEDAPAIEKLAQEFQDYLRSLGDTTLFAFNAEAYLRDGFGPETFFSGWVVEKNQQIIGYLFYHFGYDTDRAMRLMHVIDLYVQKSERRFGFGRTLMQTAIEHCQQRNIREIQWAVFAPNALAFQFYESFGAQRIQNLDFMSLSIPPQPTSKSL